MQFLDKICLKIEHGELFRLLQLSLLVLVAGIVIISGIDFSGHEIYEVNQSEKIKRYIIKKVSALPEKKKAENAKDIKTEEAEQADVLTINDIRKRYITYVISMIEQKKIYPLKEQKMNHEGVVRFILEIRKDGSVSKLSFLQRSRYKALNDSSILAVKRSQPFAKFPGQLPEDKMKIHVAMDYFLE